MGEKKKEEKMNTEQAIDALAEFQGAGHEDAPLAAMPQIRIISSNMRGYTVEGSAVCGKKTGHIWYMGDNRIVPEMEIIPSYYHDQYTEYADAKGRGMPCAVHKQRPSNASWDEGLSVLGLPNGHVIKHTGVVYGIITDAELPNVPFVIFLYSTQYKKFSEWTREMAIPIYSKVRKQYVKLPTFAKHYSLSTVSESDGKNSWFGWQIKQAGELLLPDAQGFTDARDLYFTTKQNFSKLAAGRYTAEIGMPADDEIPF